MHETGDEEAMPILYCSFLLLFIFSKVSKRFKMGLSDSGINARKAFPVPATFTFLWLCF